MVVPLTIDPASVELPSLPLPVVDACDVWMLLDRLPWRLAADGHHWCWLRHAVNNLLHRYDPDHAAVLDFDSCADCIQQYARYRPNDSDSHQCDLSLPPICLRDRKSTRLNSSHLGISYAVFCLKK